MPRGRRAQGGRQWPDLVDPQERRLDRVGRRILDEHLAGQVGRCDDPDPARCTEDPRAGVRPFLPARGPAPQAFPVPRHECITFDRCHRWNVEWWGPGRKADPFAQDPATPVVYLGYMCGQIRPTSGPRRAIRRIVSRNFFTLSPPPVLPRGKQNRTEDPDSRQRLSSCLTVIGGTALSPPPAWLGAVSNRTATETQRGTAELCLRARHTPRGQPTRHEHEEVVHDH